MKVETINSKINTAILSHQFSIEDYHRLVETGILTEDDRVELIEGMIIDMTPIGSKHASCVYYLSNTLFEKVQKRAIVAVQNPIDLSVEQSEPEPDIALLKKREDFYRDAHPKSEDILLIIEVADRSIEHDRNIKIPLYAKSLICEVWLVNLMENNLEVYRDPSLDGYHIMTRLDHTQVVSPINFPDINMPVANILLLKNT